MTGRGYSVKWIGVLNRVDQLMKYLNASLGELIISYKNVTKLTRQSSMLIHPNILILTRDSK